MTRHFEDSLDGRIWRRNLKEVHSERSLDGDNYVTTAQEADPRCSFDRTTWLLTT